MSYTIKTIGSNIYFEFMEYSSINNKSIPLTLTEHYNYAIYYINMLYCALIWVVFDINTLGFYIIPLKSNGNIITNQVNTVNELFENNPNIYINGSLTPVQINETNGELSLYDSNNIYLPLSFVPPSGGGAGAGSDPYITTFSGYTFELPHLNKWWNLFTHKSSEFTINAHTHNYSSGNYFNQIKVSYGNSKAIIDYQKKKITSNNSEFKVGKTELTLKYNKKGKIINETKLFDCIVLNHPVFEEIVLLVNWRNDYFHPIFKVQPTKDSYGLLMSKSPTFLKN